MSNYGDTLFDKAQVDLRFDRDNLDDAWSQQAILYATYSYKSQELESAASKLKIQLEEITAKLYAVEKKDFLMDGIKASESTLLNRVKLNPTYIRIKTAYENARNDADFCKNILEAFRQRRDMIVQASKREMHDQEKLGMSSFSVKKHD